jgi:C-terminal processing protease CtpA/Prc
VAAGILLAGVATAGHGRPGAEAHARPQQVEPKEETAAARPSRYAWQRTTRYDPPDFEAFFPKDSRDAADLTRLWESGELQKKPREEIMRIVRASLRGMTGKRDEFLGWFGDQYIWSASPQDPDAIEIMYHAADYRGPCLGWQSSAPVYYGLSVVQPKPPAVLHALVDLCMHTTNTSDWGRIAWGARTQRAELLAYMKPYLAAADLATRENATVVEKVLSDDPDRAAALEDWRKKRIRIKSGDRLPPIRAALQSGRTDERIEALRVTMTEELYLIMDDAFVDVFRKCAADPDVEVRRQLATALGNAMRSGFARSRSGEVIEILLRLSEDGDSQVRYNAVWQGLVPIPQDRTEDVVRRLVSIAIAGHRSGTDADLIRKIAWGLKRAEPETDRVFEEILQSPDLAHAEAARAAYQELTGRPAPKFGKSDDETRKGYAKAFQDLYEHLGAVYPNFKLKGIDWEKVGKELLPRAAVAETDRQFGLLVEELVARLEDSHAFVAPGAATPPDPGLPEWGPMVAALMDDRGQPVVYHVAARVEAWKAGVRPGMTVVSVNGVPAAEAIEQWMHRQRTFVGYSSERYLKYDAVRCFLRQQQRGAKVELALEDLAGRPKRVVLAADTRAWYIPRLPVPREGIDDGGGDVEWVKLNDGIGYIHVRRIRQGLEVKLDQALVGLGDVKGLIIDVRGNSGGGFDPTTAFQNFDLSKDRAGGPHHPRYLGPIALLIDERCISAGEGWASWFVAGKRARLFGTSTAGASARKEMYTLSNGMYKVQVPVKAYNGSLDRPIERRGLEPDVPVRASARDLARGRDTVAEAARQWLWEPVHGATPPAENSN